MNKLNVKNFVNTLTMTCLILSATALSSVAQAQEENQQVQEEQPQAQTEKHRKFYLSLGGSLQFIGEKPFGGGIFTFGFMPSPKNLFALEIGGGGGESKQVNSYSYTYYTTDSNGKPINLETRNDGKVTYGYSFIEVMFSWNRVFKMSNKWRFRLGPTIGLLDVSGSDSYSPTSYKGVTIDGLPESQSQSQSALMAGVVAGTTWNFARRWFMDINYRLTYNTALEFPEKEIRMFGETVKIESKKFGNIGNRLNIAVGWRF